MAAAGPKAAAERIKAGFFRLWRCCFGMLSQSCHAELVEASSKG